MVKQTFLDLGQQPIANGFIPKDGVEEEFFFNLKIAFDDETCLVTQQEYVAPEKMFHEDYAYRGSMSLTMVDHFQKTAKLLSESLSDSPKVLEIGSNDGVFLKNWPTDNTYAVEPCSNFAEETNGLGYKTYNRFWDKDLSDDIVAEHGSMDLIFAANCMCHIPDLRETFYAVANTLSDEGIFVFEDPSLASMINMNSYDQIYDEHAHIFSVIALKNELERVGLSIIRVDNLSVHGGSNRIWAAKVTSQRANYPHSSVEDNITYEKLLGLDDIEVFNKFSNRVAQSKQDLLGILNRCKQNGQKVISYGATSKSTTVFNYCGIDDRLISYITDTTPEKQGKLAPGSGIPIVPPKSNLIEEDVNYVFLGAWNFVDEISKKEKDFINKGGKFITHVPVVRIV